MCEPSAQPVVRLNRPQKSAPPPPKTTRKITVYFNDIAVEVLDWMEVRHALYKSAIPFGYRDGVISGEFLVCDSEGFLKGLDDTLKEGEHYFIFPATEADYVEE